MEDFSLSHIQWTDVLQGGSDLRGYSKLISFVFLFYQGHETLPDDFSDVLWQHVLFLFYRDIRGNSSGNNNFRNCVASKAKLWKMQTEGDEDGCKDWRFGKRPPWRRNHKQLGSIDRSWACNPCGCKALECRDRIYNGEEDSAGRASLVRNGL